MQPGYAPENQPSDRYKLNTALGFYERYFDLLKYSSTKNMAFVKTSVEYYNIYNHFKFSTYNDFKNCTYGDS